MKKKKKKEKKKGLREDLDADLIQTKGGCEYIGAGNLDLEVCLVSKVQWAKRGHHLLPGLGEMWLVV